MIDELVRTLREADYGHRADLACQLAREGDAAVPELMRMALGKSYPTAYIEPAWYTIWRRIPIKFHVYGLQDQLGGISALGETSSKSALDFLKRLYESRDTDIRVEDYPHQSGDSSSGLNTTYSTVGVYREYPHAGRNLRRKLEHTDYFDNLGKCSYQAVLHSTIRDAIFKLEAALAPHAKNDS